MFQNIIFTKIEKKNDVGRLIEAMVFYQKAIVVASQVNIGFILQHFGISETLELIDEGYLELKYCENVTAALDHNSRYDVVFISSPEQYDLKKVVGKIILENGGIRGSIQKEAKKVVDKIKIDNCENQILISARNKMMDQGYILEAAKLIIKDFDPTYPINKIVFQTQKSNKMIEVESNLDLQLLNLRYQQYKPNSSFSISSIFAEIVSVESEIYFASQNNSELNTNELSNTLISQSIDNEISKLAFNKKANLTLFQNQILNCRNISDAYNKGLIDFRTLLSILKKSQKFKEWLSKSNADQDLLKEYIKEIEKIDFINSLPTKVFRWIVFSILFSDLLKDPSALVIATSILDNFVLDKIFKGWKPNQFVNCLDQSIKPK
jgi:hypothetical protein